MVVLKFVFFYNSEAKIPVWQRNVCMSIIWFKNHNLCFKTFFYHSSVIILAFSLLVILFKVILKYKKVSTSD